MKYDELPVRRSMVTPLTFFIYSPNLTASFANKVEVNQYTIEGEFLKTHESITKAAEEMGVTRSAISRCCRGKSKTSCDFIWKYKDPEIYVINQYTLDGTFIKSFENIKKAAEMTGSNESSVGGCCNGKHHTSNGFVWKREVKS